MGQHQTRPGPQGTRFGEIRQFEEIDSTNRYLLEEAKNGLSAGAVVTAGHQTAGRGRLDRTWTDEPGTSLLFSVLLQPNEDMTPFRLVQAFSLAVTDACKVYAGFDAWLKWPNDVLAEGRKLAGVLAESNVSNGEVEHLVIGCGLNLNWAGNTPAGVDPAKAIAADEASGLRLDSDSMLDAVLRALEERFGHPSWISSAYAMRCSTIGSEVRVETPSEVVVGTAREVTSDGSLVVETEAGERRSFHIGDVTHLR